MIRRLALGAAAALALATTAGCPAKVSEPAGPAPDAAPGGPVVDGGGVGELDGGLDPSTQVVDLDDGTLEDYCDAFLVRFCGLIEEPPVELCGGTCCPRPEVRAAIKSYCAAPITVADVDTCGDAFHMEGADVAAIWDNSGGICIFEAFDDHCYPPDE